LYDICHCSQIMKRNQLSEFEMRQLSKMVNQLIKHRSTSLGFFGFKHSHLNPNNTQYSWRKRPLVSLLSKTALFISKISLIYAFKRPRLNFKYQTQNLNSYLSLLFIAFFLAVGVSKIQAQDPNFTQFYASPTFLNPAFTGTTEHYRFTSIYRNQWLNIPESYETNLFAFEYNLDYHNSGLGILLTNDRAKELGYMSNTVMLAYSYHVRIDKEKSFRFGLQGGYGLRNFDFNNLKFGDQLANGGATQENLGRFQSGFADFNFGMAYYTPYFWAGLSAHHLNSPNLNGAGIGQDKLPTRFSVHIGGKMAKVRRKKEIFSLQPALIVQKQGNFMSADAGMNFTNKPLIFGAWLRYNFESKQESANFLVGYKTNYLKFAYSYDLTISELSGQTGGSHEISITIEPNKDYRYKGNSKWGNRYIECPIVF
jgi:type IX secretion system PorP/SprF family membrane protein